MPSCCIKNCKSRTYQSDTKGITFFRFPKEATIREQWLNACGRDETNLKVDSATVCSNHFDTNCFIMEFTKPTSKNTFARELRRLKKGSVPSQMLTLNPEKKRKEMSQNKKSFENNKKSKANNILIKTGIPTYTELVQYTKERLHEEIVQNMKAETAKNMEGEYMKNIEKQNNMIKLKLNTNQEISTNNVAIQTLLTQLRNSEEKQQQLFEEKQNLEQKNRQLNMQITQLQAEVTKMKKNTQKETEAKAINSLHMKVLTPREVLTLIGHTG